MMFISYELVYSLGYLGALLAGFFSSVTIFFPTPGFLIVAAMAASHYFNPFILGLFAGIGAAVGETFPYWIAFGGETALSKKYDIKDKLVRIREYFEKYRAEIIIFFFAFSPLPFDVIGFFCGAIKYPFKKFFAFTLFGKVAKYTLICYAVYYGMEFAVRWYNAVP